MGHLGSWSFSRRFVPTYASRGAGRREREEKKNYKNKLSAKKKKKTKPHPSCKSCLKAVKIRQREGKKVRGVPDVRYISINRLVLDLRQSIKWPFEVTTVTEKGKYEACFSHTYDHCSVPKGRVIYIRTLRQPTHTYDGCDTLLRSSDELSPTGQPDNRLTTRKLWLTAAVIRLRNVTRTVAKWGRTHLM